MNFDTEECFRLDQGVLSVPMEGEHVVLAMGSEKYFGVRGAVRHLLDGLREGLTMGEMVDQTCARYGVDAGVARSDLDAVVGELVAAGILIQGR